MSILIGGKQAFYPVQMPDQVKNIRDLLPYIQCMGFKELTRESMHDLSVGWVDARASHDSELFSNHIMGPYHVFGVRIDTFKFSKAQIQPVFDRMVSSDYGPNKILTRQEKLELTNNVLRYLRSNSVPQTKLEYVVFDYLSSMIYILSTAESVISKVLTLLDNTFHTINDVKTGIKWDTLDRPCSHILAAGMPNGVLGKPIHVIFTEWLRSRAHTNPDFACGEESWVVILDRTINFNGNGAVVTIKSDTNLDDNMFVQDIIDSSGIELRKLQFQLLANHHSWVFTIPVTTMHPVAIAYTGAIVSNRSIEELICDRLDTLFLFRKYMEMTVNAFVVYYKPTLGA